MIVMSNDCYASQPTFKAALNLVMTRFQYDESRPFRLCVRDHEGISQGKAMNEDILVHCSMVYI